MNPTRKAQELLERYGHLQGGELLEPLILKEFPGKLALVSSFGAEAAVMLALAARIDPALPVIFLDTHKLFPETLAYRDLLTEKLGLRDVRTIYPDYADTAREDPDGTLWQANPGSCCYIRKVRTLERGLQGFEAWLTGRKRFQGGERAHLPTIEAFNGRVKINPLANWGPQQIQEAFTTYGLPEHPLKAKGYLSIGCLPCTALPADPGDPRSGRWQGSEKSECGIHIAADGTISRTG